jgi:hypothetical protein
MCPKAGSDCSTNQGPFFYQLDLPDDFDGSTGPDVLSQYRRTELRHPEDIAETIHISRDAVDPSVEVAGKTPVLHTPARDITTRDDLEFWCNEPVVGPGRRWRTPPARSG